jgi:hypothetical protein
MAGFLWVKQKDVWDRFYCVADRDNFEWLKPGAAVRHGRLKIVCSVAADHTLKTERRTWSRSPR